MHRHVCIAAVILLILTPARGEGRTNDPKVMKAISHGLEWLARNQSRIGHWTADKGQYSTAMTSLAGMAMLTEGSTTTQGRYAKNIRMAVDFLVSRSRANGLIGDPVSDSRYTYGHGFAMLFLSQVLGEEEDRQRRDTLLGILDRAVEFTGSAQTSAGGWGYVSAIDGKDFDEGSTTITQVQGLRGCRNAGIVVAEETIQLAIDYIKGCTNPDGGVRYSSKSGGGARAPITAAAIACLFNAGEYDDEYVPRLMSYCNEKLDLTGRRTNGHWHYTHYYYAQVKYREGGEKWTSYRDLIYDMILKAQSADGSWSQSYIGPVYTTAINVTILQLENACLPIYQR